MTNETPVRKHDIFFSLPNEAANDLIPEIQERIKKDLRKIIVLDDDPTGTQTVHNIVVLTEWSVQSLEKELASDAPAFYILTNSRSLTLEESQKLHREIGGNLKQASANTAVQVEVISRSDSTLRGHFPGEVDALAETLGLASKPYIIAPFFLEGGRYTINDIHYVAEDENLIPAAQTSYAQDAAFGYKHSNLKQWVDEKTGGRISAQDVTTITLDDLRMGGASHVTEKLVAVREASAVAVNCASYRDMEVFILGLLEAEAQGCTFLPRTAASFVQVRMGMRKRELLKKEELVVENGHGGLIIVGSYVPKTTAQLQALLTNTAIERIEVRIKHLLDKAMRDVEVVRTTHLANLYIKNGKDVVIYTSRELVKGGDAASNLSIGSLISNSLISIVRNIEAQPRYIIAKGGITSSDVATKGLNIKRALVLGQALPGVPVWQLGAESRYPGMSYIVFPGNVGDENALADLQKRLAKD